MSDRETHPIDRKLCFKDFGQLAAFKKVQAERDRQDSKWGVIGNFDNRRPEEWLTILMEEVGELAEGVLKRDQENVLEEATQVAAVATAIVESMQRRSVGERD